MAILQEGDRQKAQIFLEKMNTLLITKEYTIEINSKNKSFDEQFPIKSCVKEEILKSLTLDDCVKIEENINPRYPEAELYFFIKKNVEICVYGEDIKVTLYLKMYICEESYYDRIIVISFHEEGMHE